MYTNDFPSVRQLLKRRSQRNLIIFLVMVLALLLVYGLVLLIVNGLPGSTDFHHSGKGAPEFLPLVVGLGVVGVSFLMAILWHRPIYGLYSLLLIIGIFGGDPRNSVSKVVTNYLPLFLPMNNIGDIYGTGALSGIKFTPYEILLTLVFIFWFVQLVIRRNQRFRPGIFLLPLCCYLAVVFYGMARGYSSGGDSVILLQQSRAQYTLILVYILVTNMVRTPKDLERVLWFLVIGIGIRSLLGVGSYLQLRGHITDQGIMEHEDSLIMNFMFFMPVLLAVTGGPKKLYWGSLLMVPSALIVEFENNRRAGIAAFVVAFIILWPGLFILFKEHRKKLAIISACSAVFLAIYLPLGWNSESSWALPARAIRSNSDPSSRDTLSNLYRVQEDIDLKYTRDQNPILGYGYGKRWIQIVPLPMVSTDYMYYFAHNSVLWFWMTNGHIGFFIFLMCLSYVLIKSVHACKVINHPLHKTAALMAVVFTIMQFTFGKYDLQLFYARSMALMIIFWALVGISIEAPVQEEIQPTDTFTIQEEDYDDEPLDTSLI